jgi:hypothetical protein
MLLDTCIDIAYQAKARRALSTTQVAFLNELDLDLAKLTQRTDTPVVVDIHSEPNSRQVVEEGVALPKPAQMQIPGTGKAAWGALFQHREFKQPIDQRLTDEEWAAKLLKHPK